MALDKAIAHGKEHRKQYFGSKAIDCTCRNHGSCVRCRDNRQYKNKKNNQKMLDILAEYDKDKERK